jgi:multiple sugar transport system substrate-binding protein
MDLMAGRESWTDERVKNVFTQWESILPYHQENPNGRTWEEAGSAFASGECGMMTIGNFVGSQFPNGDTSDLDFFPWPEMNAEFGTDTIEAPIDGWMMAKNAKNPAAAKEFLFHLGSAAAQTAYLSKDPSVIGAAQDIDVALYNPLQQKAIEAVAAAGTVTQFLDRDASPEFASNVAGQAFADFLADPSSIDSVLEDVQAQAEAIYSE